MKLRAYNPDDFEALYRVEEQCFEVPIRFDREYMQELLARKGSIAFVIEMRNGIAGFAIVSAHKKAHQNYAYIETLEVLEEFRGRGLARKLLTRLEACARHSHASLMVLHVDCTNEHAIRLYVKCGYSKVKEHLNFYPNGHTAFIYKKELSTA